MESLKEKSEKIYHLIKDVDNLHSIFSNHRESVIIDFLYHVCVEEDIGIQNKEIINETINKIRLEKINYDEKKTELINLYKTFSINKEVLCVETIQNIHEILLKDLIHFPQTAAGEFSTKIRCTNYKGKRHFYPTFESIEDCNEAVYAVVTQFNHEYLDIYCDYLTSIENKEHYTIGLIKVFTIKLIL